MPPCHRRFPPSSCIPDPALVMLSVVLYNSTIRATAPPALIPTRNVEPPPTVISQSSKMNLKFVEVKSVLPTSLLKCQPWKYAIPVQLRLVAPPVVRVKSAPASKAVSPSLIDKNKTGEAEVPGLLKLIVAFHDSLWLEWQYT